MKKSGLELLQALNISIADNILVFSTTVTRILRTEIYETTLNPSETRSMPERNSYVEDVGMEAFEEGVRTSN
jgi:hypothetical protein